MPASLNKSIVQENNRIPSPALTKSSRILERVGLVICGVLALAFAIVVPPLQLNDEHGHFIRAYAISRGEYVGRGIPALPAPVVSFVMRYPELAERVHKFTPQEIVRDLPERPVTDPAEGTALTNADGHHKYVLWAIIGSATYCPLVYLPASLGIWAARTMHASPLVMMYAARMFNVLTFVAALAISFHLAPRYRALMTGVALMPMTLQQAGGISGDLVTIAFSFVGLSLVLYAREHPVNRRFLGLVALVFTMWSLCKFSIWALPLLLLIPVSAFRSWRVWLAYIGAVSICMIGALLIWNGVDSANVEAFHAARLTYGIDMSANVRLMAAHPFAFAQQLLDLFESNWGPELMQFVGAFGWGRFSLPPWVALLYLLLLVIVASTEFSTKPFRRWERGVLFLVFLAGAVFIHALIFVSDGTICGGSLERFCFESSAGVQGRYFLPFCLAGFLTLRRNRTNVPQITLLSLVTGIGTIHAVAALALIRSTFYL
jgi:uncharacterized membrane protein